MTASDIKSLLATLEDPQKAEHAQRFFKTGPGEYGEGDVFRGIRVPALRQIARQYRKLPLSEARLLLHSPFHEDRFVALCILVHLYNAGAHDDVYRTYLNHTRFINSWDLVDASVHKIVGPYLFERIRRPLYTLVESPSLWERRMAIMATYLFIRHNQFTDALALSEILLEDEHDLIHKATGWMLREVGKRDEDLLLSFLGRHYRIMPRTMLRYAIERLDKRQRRAYLEGRVEATTDSPATWQAYRAVMEADRRLQSFDLTTPLLKSSAIGQAAGCDVLLKQEHLQHTGSFKYRGAVNKLSALESSTIVITAASTGNHGLAVAKALRELRQTGTIFLPETADAHKVDKLRGHGASVVITGQDGVDAEHAARTAAESQLGQYISPYNDWDVLGGQGTVGLELLSQVSDISHVFVAVGGGALIAGIAAAMKTHKPDVQVIGCSPDTSPVMHESVRTGKVVNLPVTPTLSDGTAGGLEPHAITFPLCQKLVDTWITVTEEEIVDAMRRLFHAHKLMVEGAAGVALAGLLKMGTSLAGARVAVVLCGGNIKPEKFKSIVEQAAN